MKFLKFDYFKGLLSELHIHLSVQDFAVSLVGVFIPIFLLDLGFSLVQVLTYYLIYFACFALFSFLSHSLSRIGFKKVMMLRPAGLIIFFIWLYSLEFFPDSLYVLGVFNGFISSFYWVTFHYFFTRHVNEDCVDEDVGLMIGLPKMFKVLSPLIGAVILFFFSFNVLFIVSSVLLFVSIIPLLHLEDYHFVFRLNWKDFFEKSSIKYFLGFFADGVNYVIVYVLLPLYFFLVFNQTFGVGAFSTLLNASGFLTPLLVAHVCKGRSSLLIKIGAVLEAVVFLSFYFISSDFQFLFFALIVGIVASLWNIPFYSRMYKHARRINTLEFLIFREFLLNISRVFIVGILLLTLDFKLVFFFEILSKFFLFAF